MLIMINKTQRFVTAPTSRLLGGLSSGHRPAPPGWACTRACVHTGGRRGFGEGESACVKWWWGCVRGAGGWCGGVCQGWRSCKERWCARGWCSCEARCSCKGWCLCEACARAGAGARARPVRGSGNACARATAMLVQGPRLVQDPVFVPCPCKGQCSYEGCARPVQCLCKARARPGTRARPVQCSCKARARTSARLRPPRGDGGGGR